MNLTWNTATNFALVGTIIAVAIAFLAFGWYWIYLPGLISALATVYVVSTRLGKIARAKANGIIGCVGAGITVAVVTLLMGVAALGVTNVILAWVENALSLRWGLGPFYSLTESFKDLVLQPLYWVSLIGGWVAVVFGIVYGGFLHSQRRRTSHDSSEA